MEAGGEVDTPTSLSSSPPVSSGQTLAEAEIAEAHCLVHVRQKHRAGGRESASGETIRKYSTQDTNVFPLAGR